MSWDTGNSGQSFLAHYSSSFPQFLGSYLPQSLSLNIPYYTPSLELSASTLDMTKSPWYNAAEYGWANVKPRKTTRTVRHHLNSSLENGPRYDNSRVTYRNISPTHNVNKLSLGYIPEDSVYPRPATSGEDWNGGATTSFDNANGGMDYGSGDANGYGGGDDGAKDGNCNNCGQEGHFARDCPEPKKMGACFNCGEEGHSKAECTQPRKFTGTCRTCNEEGHQARDCPSKPKICNSCKEEGHDALECQNKMKLDMNNIADKTQDEAWALLTKASDERDLDDFKDAVKMLVKAVPETTYVELEQEFRKRNFGIYLIGMVKESGPTWTNVDLQGNIGKKFAVGYYYNDKPQRPTLAPKWPKDTADNLERLAHAGTPMDRGVEMCNNCNEVGHSKRNCPQDIMEIERVTISCMLCGEEGHRVRDCAEERPKPRGPRACKVCESTEHLAKECPNREKRTCRKCGSEDHMAKECDIIKCDNCDEEGHLWKDCPKPKDWSRVKCRNCGEMGHTIKRCKQPIKEELQNGPAPTGGVDAGAGGAPSGDGDDSGAGAANSGGWANGACPPAGDQNGWEKAYPAPAVASGGW